MADSRASPMSGGDSAAATSVNLADPQITVPASSEGLKPPVIDVHADTISRVIQTPWASIEAELYVPLYHYEYHGPTRTELASTAIGASLGYTYGIDPGYVNALTAKLLYLYDD